MWQIFEEGKWMPKIENNGSWVVGGWPHFIGWLGKGSLGRWHLSWRLKDEEHHSWERQSEEKGKEGEHIQRPWGGEDLGMLEEPKKCWQVFKCGACGTRLSNFFKPTLLASGEFKFLLFPARHASKLAVCWVCVSVRKSEWITCQAGEAGAWLAGCGVCVFSVYSSSLLPCKYMPNCHAPFTRKPTPALHRSWAVLQKQIRILHATRGAS